MNGVFQAEKIARGKAHQSGKPDRLVVTFLRSSDSIIKARAIEVF